MEETLTLHSEQCLDFTLKTKGVGFGPMLNPSWMLGGKEAGEVSHQK